MSVPFVIDPRTIDDARSGCREAWSHLFTLHHAPLLRYLARRTADPELASDLVQDTFLIAFRRRDAIPKDRPFVAWLFRISLNLLSTYERSQRRHPTYSLDAVSGVNGSKLSDSNGVRDLLTVDDRDMLERGLHCLSPSSKDALLLHV